MMNLEQVAQNFLQQQGALGERMRLAVAYKTAAQTGEISAEEYRELMTDLQRLDDIQLAADELDQKIAFNEVMTALMSIPLP